MGNTIIYLETNSMDPCFNLAFEEYILTHKTQGDYLLLWQNENTVVIGQNQIAEAEVNLPVAREYHTKIVRRTTGGGAVYHDRGNLNYSFISTLSDVDQFSMDAFTQPVVAALQDLGLSAEASGRNDILVSGYKVSGTAQRIYKNRILYHGTLLFDADKTMAENVLQVNPLKFQGKHAKSVRARIGNIKDFLPEEMELSAFWMYLKKKLTEKNHMVEEKLTPMELEAVQKLSHEKYADPQWTFRHMPQFDFYNEKKWNGGILEIRLCIAKEKITNAAFYGDFMSEMAVREIEQALIGTPYTPNAVRCVLEKFPLKRYFGEITVWEILQTMFLE